jgi:hypothetical protein
LFGTLSQRLFSFALVMKIAFEMPNSIAEVSKQ